MHLILALIVLLIGAPALAADINSSMWSESDNSNNAAPPNGWPENMNPSQVNDAARANMGGIKRWYDHINATATTGGSANAQTLTYSVAPAALVAGDVYTFFVGAGLTNTGAATLNINGLGAKAVQVRGAALVGGELTAGLVAQVIYDGTQFQLITQNQPRMVTQWGAKGDGVTDDGPAIRAAIATVKSGGELVFPPGTYLICSTVASPDPGQTGAGILVQNASNLVLTGYGAHLKMCNSSPAACSTVNNGNCSRGEIMLVANANGLTIRGFIFEGYNYSVSGPSVEVSALSLDNMTNGHVYDNTFNNWGGVGAPIAGAWIAHSSINHNYMPQAALALDVAFLYDVDIAFNKASGADSSGNPGGGSAGFSIIYDAASVANNQTGISFTNSQNVRLTNNYATGFNTGMYIGDGSGIAISGGHLYNNTSASVSAVGLQLQTMTSKDSSDITVSGVTFSGNGKSDGSGAGLLVSAPISTGKINNLLVTGNIFDNNNAFGLHISTSSHDAIQIVGNRFLGANQTTSIDTSNLSATLHDFLQANSGFVLNALGAALPAGTGAGNAVLNNGSYPVQVHYWTGASAVVRHIILASGATLDDGQAITSTTDTCILMPGDAIYFTTNIPVGWIWTPLQ